MSEQVGGRVRNILDYMCRYVCTTGNKYLNPPTNIWYLQSARRFVKVTLTSLMWYEIASSGGAPLALSGS